MLNMPYWRLSAFYFFYFASVGAFMPYWNLYLQALQFDPKSIGELMATLAVTKVIAPNIWGWLADRTGRHILLVRFSTLCSLIAFSGVLLGHSYWWLVCVMLLFSFFWNAALPQIEATTFSYLEKQFHRYAHIRLWGSIGFICVALLLGQLFEHFSITWLPILIMVPFISMWIVSLLIVDKHNVPPTTHAQVSIKEVALRPEVIALFVICLLMQVSHGPYYTFYSIYLESAGYARSVIGQLWALGVIAEIGIFLLMHRLIQSFSLRHLLMISFLVGGIRWLLIGFFIANPVILLCAQLMHAASFGIYHAVTILIVSRYFTGALQGRGQALYSSIGFGIGGALGNWLSGYLWEPIGAQFCFLLASVVSTLALFVTWRWIADIAPSSTS